MKYREEQQIKAEKALAVGMAEKAKEFKATGGETYHGKPDGVDDHHWNFSQPVF